MLHCQLLRDQGIVILRPEGPLHAEDFEAAARLVDPIIRAEGRLHGILVDAPHFPGWADFAALVSHLQFVRGHHEHVEKVAAVTDGELLSRLPKLARHFVRAEIRHFPTAQREQALAWLRQAD